MVTVIGISGHSKAGKDVLATELVERHGYVRIGFGDAIKEEALTHFPWLLANLWKSYRIDNRSIVRPDFEPHDPTPADLRRFVWEEKPPLVVNLLQDLGNLRRAADPDHWVKAWQKTVERREDFAPDNVLKVVAPDVRSDVEAVWLRSFGRAVCVLAKRPGADGDGHATEAFADSAHKFDAILQNDGTLEDWQAKAGFLATLVEE